MGSIPTGTKSRNNLTQVIFFTFTCLCQWPSSITWYWSKDGDVLWLGRWPQAWRKVMAAYRREWLKKSPAGWLPVDLDQLRAQRSVTKIGELYLFTVTFHTAVYRLAVLMVYSLPTKHCLFSFMHTYVWLTDWSVTEHSNKSQPLSLYHRFRQRAKKKTIISSTNTPIY